MTGTVSILTILMMMTQVISPVTSDDSDDDTDVFDDCSEEAVDCATVLRTGQYLCLDLDIDPETQQVTLSCRLWALTRTRSSRL